MTPHKAVVPCTECMGHYSHVLLPRRAVTVAILVTSITHQVQTLLSQPGSMNQQISSNPDAVLQPCCDTLPDNITSSSGCDDMTSCPLKQGSPCHSVTQLDCCWQPRCYTYTRASPSLQSSLIMSSAATHTTMHCSQKWQLDPCWAASAGQTRRAQDANSIKATGS